MRVAILAHLRHPIAPPFAGGMEAHSWHLAARLAARGHDVTLFASGDSVAGAPPGVRVHPVIPRHYDVDYPWHLFHGTKALNAYQDAAFARVGRVLLASGFDVVHNNSLHRYPPRLARAKGMPMLTSLHVPPFDALRRAVHDGAAPWSRFTVTSHRQVAAWWPGGMPPEACVLPNGIDPALWPFQADGDGSAAWVGRITPTKGTHLAVEAARLAGIPLTIYGAIEDRAYFDTAVASAIGRGVTYGGHLSGGDLARRLGSASVLLFTPLWDEPFGLAAIEAMATGLPVAALNMGAVAEVVGDCGSYAPPGDAAALARAIGGAMRISRHAARARVEAFYTLDRMVDRAERLYRRVIAAARAPVPAIVYPPIELAIAPPETRTMARMRVRPEAEAR